MPDDDDVIECACGYMALKDGATPNSGTNATILDERKHKVNLYANLYQCYNAKYDLLKKEKINKINKNRSNGLVRQGYYAYY